MRIDTNVYFIFVIFLRYIHSIKNFSLKYRNVYIEKVNEGTKTLIHIKNCLEQTHIA
jgi:hypothetical protein